MPIILTPIIIAKAPGRLCEGLISLLESQPSIRIIGVIIDESCFFEELKKYSPPYILIMDIALFGDSIFEICHNLRTQNPQYGCILMVNTIDEKARGFSAGANDVLIKGYSMEELLDAIQRVRYVKFMNITPYDSGSLSFKSAKTNL